MSSLQGFGVPRGYSHQGHSSSRTSNTSGTASAGVCVFAKRQTHSARTEYGSPQCKAGSPGKIVKFLR